jgi:hypothetical protein
MPERDRGECEPFVRTPAGMAPTPLAKQFENLSPILFQQSIQSGRHFTISITRMSEVL